MKQNLSLDDVVLFVAVADAGGLAGASRTTGASVPTLSRRMTELESKIGMRLFARGRRGYSLTADGRALLEEAKDLRALAAKLKAFANREEKRSVRITAGHWTSHFLARHIRHVWSGQSQWVPVFSASNMPVDIARREADIGIRNHRPEQSWLAGRRTGHVQYATFAASDRVTGYVSTPFQSDMSASQRWLHAHHGNEIIMTTNTIGLAVTLACEGVGQVLLPSFVAEAFPQLVRTSDSIADLETEEWLVCHHEARHDPPIRKALDALAALLTDPAKRPRL